MRRQRRPKRIVKSENSLNTKVGVIPYILTRSSGRRTLSITIDERARTGVAAPFNMAEKVIHDFIHEKAEWITEKLKEAQSYRIQLEEKEYAHGRQFLFLGKKFLLNVVQKKIKRSAIHFDPTLGWEIKVPEQLTVEEQGVLIKKKMLLWYRQQAEEVLGGRIFHYSRIIGDVPKKIAVRSQKRLWGCCDYNTQTIHLNWQIILSPIDVVDYIVVHELCHLKIPNHSKRFWKKVEKVMPDYKRRQKWLKMNHIDMILP